MTHLIFGAIALAFSSVAMAATPSIDIKNARLLGDKIIAGVDATLPKTTLAISGNSKCRIKLSAANHIGVVYTKPKDVKCNGIKSISEIFSFDIERDKFPNGSITLIAVAFEYAVVDDGYGGKQSQIIRANRIATDDRGIDRNETIAIPTLAPTPSVASAPGGAVASAPMIEWVFDASDCKTGLGRCEVEIELVGISAPATADVETSSHSSRTLRFTPNRIARVSIKRPTKSGSGYLRAQYLNITGRVDFQWGIDLPTAQASVGTATAMGGAGINNVEPLIKFGCPEGCDNKASLIRGKGSQRLKFVAIFARDSNQPTPTEAKIEISGIEEVDFSEISKEVHLDPNGRVRVINQWIEIKPSASMIWGSHTLTATALGKPSTPKESITYDFDVEYATTLRHCHEADGTTDARCYIDKVEISSRTYTIAYAPWLTKPGPVDIYIASLFNEVVLRHPTGTTRSSIIFECLAPKDEVCGSVFGTTPVISCDGIEIETPEEDVDFESGVRKRIGLTDLGGDDFKSDQFGCHFNSTHPFRVFVETTRPTKSAT